MKRLLVISSVLLFSVLLTSALAQRAQLPGPSTAASAPVLDFSTCLGGGADDTGNAIAVDRAGNIYVAGTTLAPGLPGAQPLPGSTGGAADVFVAKLDPTGARVLYLVWLGGSGEDRVNGLALEGTNVSLTGFTTSGDFPAVNALGPTPAGANAFVAKINGSGTDFVFCTVLGGANDDSGQAIAVDQAGNLWVTGWTESPDFPTHNPLPGVTGGRDAFVTKLSPDGSQVLFSSLLGGTDEDSGQAIALDLDGNAYVTGSTASTDFPALHALQPALAGAKDAFVTALKADGSALVYSTYLGGGETDLGFAISVDAQANAYVTGQTGSPDFPVLHALQEPGGGNDAFVAQIAPQGAAWVFSTRLGGSGSDAGLAIAVDSAGRVCVAGQTASTDFPKLNALQASYAGGLTDGFVARLKPGSAGLDFATWLGSSGEDWAGGIAVDAGGAVYVTGWTHPLAKDLQFPTSPGARQAVFGGGFRDAFVSKLSPTSPRQPNDNLADAWVLDGTLLTTLGRNGDASLEPGEPQHAQVDGGKSVWWTWQAPSNGPVILNTKGSDFDTVLAVYTGATIPTLQAVAASDDDPVQGALSRVYFEAQAGTTYALAVAGKAGASGNIILTLSLGLPPNDDFAYRIALASLPATITTSNGGATAEPGEPNQFEYYDGGQSIWWSWTAPADMKVGLDTTGSDFGPAGEPSVVVYTGTSLAGVVEVASNYRNTKNPLFFSAQGGTTYQISVDGNDEWHPSGAIVLQCYQATTAANDDFANRGDLSELPLPITIETNLSQATIEPGETPWYSGYGCTLWWTLTPRSTMNLILSATSASTPNYAPILNVFTGDAISTLERMVGSTYGVPCASPSLNRVTIRAVAGTSYQIGLDAMGVPGQATLTVEQATPPPNDDFAQAIVLSGAEATATGANLGATYEAPYEGRHEYSQGGSIWWSWTAPADGNVQFSTEGSDPAHSFDISVWTGDALNHLEVVVENETVYDFPYSPSPCANGFSDLANFKARAGQTYYLAADGSVFGTVKLNLTLLPPPPNDDFAQALPLGGLTNLVRESNVGATKEPGEPWHAAEPGGQSLWWTWTAPTSGHVLVDTPVPAPGGLGTVALGIYTGDTVNNLQEVANNHPASYTHTNRLSFQAVAGTKYRIAADTLGWTGDIVFSLVEQPLLRVDPAAWDPQGRFQVSISGATTNRFVIQTSTNLTHWVPLLTNVLVDQTFQFTDPEAKPVKYRFYRALELP